MNTTVRRTAKQFSVFFLLQPAIKVQGRQIAMDAPVKPLPLCLRRSSNVKLQQMLNLLLLLIANK